MKASQKQVCLLKAGMKLRKIRTHFDMYKLGENLAFSEQKQDRCDQS